MTSVGERIYAFDVIGKEIGVYALNGYMLFLGTDIANILGERDGYTVSRKVDKNNKIMTSVLTNGGLQRTVLLTINGVSQALAKQRKTSSTIIDNIKSDFFKNGKIQLPLFVSNEKLEMEFLHILQLQLKVLNVELLRQYYCGKYRIDFYIPEVNLAIEYDEAHHLAAQNSNSDRRREQKIKDSIGCEFLRLSFKNSHIENSALVIAHIMKLKYIQKQNVIDLNSNELSILADGVSMARKILGKN